MTIREFCLVRFAEGDDREDVWLKAKVAFPHDKVSWSYIRSLARQYEYAREFRRAASDE